jgi:MerR family transcriptional regulator, mercuric resistance operon regulatory protein
MTAITDSRGLTIGALSRLTGVNIETIRYYEKIELTRKPPRTRGGHRSYAQEHVERLRFIGRARALGFGIEGIRALLTLSAGGENSCAKAREIAAAHLADVRAKREDLAKLEAILSDTIAQCDARCSEEIALACPVLEVLES